MDRYELDGMMLTVTELLLLSTNGISRTGLGRRLRAGTPAREAITRPVLSASHAALRARRSSWHHTTKKKKKP